MKTIPQELLQEVSDVDLLVITRDSQERPAQRATRAYRSLRGLMVPTDIMVKTRAEVNRCRHVTTSLEHEVIEHGKVLYG